MFRKLLMTLSVIVLCCVSVSAQQDMDELRQDLKVLDNITTGQPTSDVRVNLTTVNVDSRKVYRHYIEEASDITEELIKLDKAFEASSDQLSLQRLAAMTQQIKADHKRLRNSFSHGEESFESYRLIHEAVYNLDDAIKYWQLSLKFRPVYRGSAWALVDDDEVLRVKLLNARRAIKELQTIQQARAALDKDLQPEF